jgi:hypothetical protein
MGKCEVCGNQYDKAFELVSAGTSHVFDSFECAIHALAPACDHCGCRILGHGMESMGRFFCCAHCAEAAGVPRMTDRVETLPREQA